MVKVVAVSGYKSSELSIFKQNHPAISYIKAAIRKELMLLLDDGLEWVIISGQLGTELWAAEVVFELQLEYPQLQLGVITPFLDQQENWSEMNKEWYESILSQADFIDSITRKKYEKPWQFRLKNQFFVEKSDALLLFYDQEKEGSPKFLYETACQYKVQNPYEIRSFGFYELQVLVEEEQEQENTFQTRKGRKN